MRYIVFVICILIVQCAPKMNYNSKIVDDEWHNCNYYFDSSKGEKCRCQPQVAQEDYCCECVDTAIVKVR